MKLCERVATDERRLGYRIATVKKELRISGLSL